VKGNNGWVPCYEAPYIGWLASKLFKGPKGASQNETMEKEESWGTFPNSQHFGVGRCVGASGWD
jgi:hypothetical protein